MSDKILRPITDVEIVEQMTENDTVLIEQNGEIKRTKGVGGLPKGGSPHQQLVTDAEGNTKWEDKLAYSSIETVEILAETTVVPMNEDGYGISTTFAEGYDYIVTYDGVQYRCTARNYDGYIMIGNNVIHEYDDDENTDTGEPFAIECQEGSTSCLVYFSDDNTDNHLISISCITEENVHQIDPKFIPNGAGATKDFVLWTHYVEAYSGSRTEEHKMNFTYEELHNAIINFDKVPTFYWYVKVDYEEMNSTAIESTTFAIDRPTKIIGYQSQYSSDQDIMVYTSFDNNSGHYLTIKSDGTVSVSKWTNV